jgi:deoxycytidylate deaminase
MLSAAIAAETNAVIALTKFGIRTKIKIRNSKSFDTHI